MIRPLIHVSGANIAAPGGRPLLEGLRLSLSREHVALVGRNGVGKSTLLLALSGEEAHAQVKLHRKPHFVPQMLSLKKAGDRALSHGEIRRRSLDEARRSGAEILLLDEPTEDLDEPGVSWLRTWLREWPGCLLVASHDRRLLQDFRCFFIMGESGCRCFSGSLAELDDELERDHRESQERYVQSLNRLVEKEEHMLHIARRKARKKQYGRCRELDRGTPRIRLNQKRDHAQVSHGKLAHVREARIAAAREWSKSMRRALHVSLPLELSLPALPPFDGESLLALRDVSAVVGDRRLFAGLTIMLGRERAAVVGPNGAGKTTLLEIMLGERAPSAGSVVCDRRKVGAIAQGGTNWMLDESLLGWLSVHSRAESPDALAKILVAHKFPLGLSERPLRSLSPGERVRAALICLFERSPPVELLVLDEPTFSLDRVGQRALADALAVWPGGLVVASHDRGLLSAIGVDHSLELGR